MAINEEKAKRLIQKRTNELTELAEYALGLEKQLEAAPKAEDFAKLQAQLRGDRHKTAFEKAAAKAGVRPEAVGDLYQLLGLKAETDEPDEKEIGKALDKALETRSWAKAEPKEEPKAVKLPPGEGATRGQSGASAATLTVSKSDLGDHAYMAKHQAAIAAASAAGSLQIV